LGGEVKITVMTGLDGKKENENKYPPLT